MESGSSAASARNRRIPKRIAMAAGLSLRAARFPDIAGEAYGFLLGRLI